ncbi:MAG: hypothetical protein WD627_12745 [Actinomycetota bacterium]
MIEEEPKAELKAVFLNCTLKRFPAISHAEGLARKVIEWFDTMDVESEMVRVIDYNIPSRPAGGPPRRFLMRP